MRRKTARIAALAVFFALAAQFAPFLAFADGPAALSVTPVVIDEKAQPRDIIDESITITNTGSQQLELYPSVNDINSAIGEQSFQVALDSTEASSSLSNWIQLSRGVIELGPGEQKTVPFEIQVPSDAPNGTYHALISFANGATRDSAVASGSLANVTVNVDIASTVIQLLQLNAFTSDNLVFTGGDVLFTYQLQNTGNQPLDPKGEIDIYDRRGVEVASVGINNNGTVISPDQVNQLASTWNDATGFGQYKAVINVIYGTSQVASVQDVAYFWVIPWKELLGISIAALIGLIFAAMYANRWLEELHFGKFSAAGLIKSEHLASAAPIPTPAPVPPVAAPAESARRRRFNPFASWRREKQKLSDLTRKGFVSPAAVVTPPTRQQPAARATLASSTIDLKKIAPRPEEVVPEAHVINLKKQ